jgi:hypothetical protein
MKFLLILVLGFTSIQVYAKNALTFLRKNKHRNSMNNVKNQDKMAGKI